MSRLYILLFAMILLSGCVQKYPVPRYSVSADNVTQLRALNGIQISVGKFTSSYDKLRGHCEGSFLHIMPPDNQTFAGYIRKAFIDDLKMANIYSESASIILTGNINEAEITISLVAPENWHLSLTINSSNGKSLTIIEDYSFESWSLDCNHYAMALMPAVQDLIGNFVRHPKFIQLVE